MKTVRLLFLAAWSAQLVYSLYKGNNGLALFCAAFIAYNAISLIEMRNDKKAK